MLPIGSFHHNNVIAVIQLDDALSAMKLSDGKIKVWIHVADPACLVEPQSILDRLINCY